MKNKIVTLEETQELIDFLQGSCPDNMSIKHMPNLSAEQSFAVLYYLQEQMHLIPDTYEMCDGCHELYDSDEEGDCIGDEHFCYGCWRDGIKEDRYKKYQLKQMIQNRVSLHHLIEELELYRRTQKQATLTIPELYQKWQKDNPNKYWLSMEKWLNHDSLEMTEDRKDLSTYAEYQLKN